LADFGAARRPNVYGDGKRIHQGNDALSGTEVPFDFTTIFGEIIRCQIGDVGGEQSHSNWLANI
jgi:hypothetical protein